MSEHGGGANVGRSLAALADQSVTVLFAQGSEFPFGIDRYYLDVAVKLLHEPAEREALAGPGVGLEKKARTDKHVEVEPDGMAVSSMPDGDVRQSSSYAASFDGLSPRPTRRKKSAPYRLRVVSTALARASVPLPLPFVRESLLILR